MRPPGTCLGSGKLHLAQNYKCQYQRERHTRKAGLAIGAYLFNPSRHNCHENLATKSSGLAKILAKILFSSTFCPVTHDISSTGRITLLCSPNFFRNGCLLFTIRSDTDTRERSDFHSSFFNTKNTQKTVTSTILAASQPIYLQVRVRK